MKPDMGQIFHIGYIVPDLLAAMQFWVAEMGVGPFHVQRHGDATGERITWHGEPMPADFLVGKSTGDVDIELIAMNGDFASPHRDYLRANPHGGAHHLGLLVDDFDAAIADPEIAARIITIGHHNGIRTAYLEGGMMGTTMLELIETVPMMREKLAAARAASQAWDGRDPIRYASAEVEALVMANARD
ncbi:MAG: VOC family protein [Novosphingobium sp.]